MLVLVSEVEEEYYFFLQVAPKFVALEILKLTERLEVIWMALRYISSTLHFKKQIQISMEHSPKNGL
jgi:hypothetical protein